MPKPMGSRSSERLSDEELDYYGNLYVLHGIRAAGVEFENYLSNPEYWLDRHTGRRWRGEAGLGDGRRGGLAAYLRLRRGSRNGEE